MSRGSRLTVADANRLNKLMCKAADAVGVDLDSLGAVSEKKMLSNLSVILDNVSHLLHDLMDKQRSLFRVDSSPRDAPHNATGSHSRLRSSDYLTHSVTHSESIDWPPGLLGLDFSPVRGCLTSLL